MMKYDWDLFFDLIKKSQFDTLIPKLEEYCFKLGLKDSIEKEIESKTFFIDNLEQKTKCKIFLYLKILFADDVSEFTKEIQYNTLVQNLTKTFENKVNDIKNNISLSSEKKDEILESFDINFEREIKILTATYQERYNSWVKQHQFDMDQYNLVKNKIECWVNQKI